MWYVSRIYRDHRQENKNNIIQVLQYFLESVNASAQISIEAAGIFSKVQSPDFWTIAELVKKVLLLMKPLNNLLQVKDIDIVSALEFVDQTKQELKNLRSEENFLRFWSKCSDRNIQETPEKINKRSRNPSKNLAEFVVLSPIGQREGDNSKKLNMKRMFFNILDVTISELEARFSERHNTILRSLPCFVPRSETFLNIDDMLPLASLVLSDIERTELRLEIPPAKSFLEKSVSEIEEIGYVLKYLTKFRDAFPRLYQVYCAAATLGVSTAACERSFSAVTRILKPCRVSMSHTRKSDLVQLSVEKQLTCSISNEEFLQKFKITSSGSSRRLVI